MNCSRHLALETLADALIKGARRELHLTPKPGLVDLADNGSHPDLSVPLMEQSIGIVADYLGEIVDTLRRGEAFPAQKAAAIRAERRLYDELGTNTHKGYIFLSGMLLVAHSHAGTADEKADEPAVRQALSAVSQEFFNTSGEKHTHGERVRRDFNVGGIIREAIGAYPSLYEEALPVFHETVRRRGCENAAAFAMMGRLMQTVDDTTTLHRSGPPGLARVKRDGRVLEQLIADGGEYLHYLETLNRAYIQANITIGGVADMLGLAFAHLIASGKISD